MDISLDKIDAKVISEVSALMPVQYLFWTKDGMVSIGPDHPQYDQAKKVEELRMKRLFKKR